MKYLLIFLAFLVPAILVTVAIDEWVAGKWSVLARSFVLFAAIFGSSFCIRKIAGMPVDGMIKGAPLFLVVFIGVSVVYLLL